VCVRVFAGVCDVAVFAQVVAGFRYGREDLDVLGLNFRRDLIDVSAQVQFWRRSGGLTSSLPWLGWGW